MVGAFTADIGNLFQLLQFDMSLKYCFIDILF